MRDSATERISAVARAETAGVRGELRADVLRLERDLQDVTAQRDAAQITSRRAEEERGQAVAALAGQLAALQGAHAAELARLKDVHALEIGRIGARVGDATEARLPP